MLSLYSTSIISSIKTTISAITTLFVSFAAGPVEQSGGMDGKPIDAQRLQALAEAVREGNVG